jgi:anti-sigma regulatory factor (Ser/Thr protein kinase)
MVVSGDAYGLAYDVQELHECVLLRPRGELDQDAAARLGRAVYVLLMDRGRVVLDISTVTASQVRTLARLPNFLARAGGWPLARLVLLGAGPTVSAALRLAELDQTVSLASDWKAATDLLRARPRCLARESLMPATIEAPTLARAAIREVCREWDLNAVSMEAEMTAVELVANAANHAGTESTLACTLAGGDLHIAVRDWDAPSDTTLQRITDRAGERRGLTLVAGVAHSWGCIRHQNGKTVWAILKNPASP